MQKEGLCGKHLLLLLAWGEYNTVFADPDEKSCLLQTISHMPFQCLSQVRVNSLLYKFQEPQWLFQDKHSAFVKVWSANEHAAQNMSVTSNFSIQRVGSLFPF